VVAFGGRGALAWSYVFAGVSAGHHVTAGGKGIETFLCTFRLGDKHRQTQRRPAGSPESGHRFSARRIRGAPLQSTSASKRRRPL